MVTHDPRYAAAATQRVRLFDGKMIEDATVTAELPSAAAV
jgi:ABC-type lipoprotein export system ATPase subunit